MLLAFELSMPNIGSWNGKWTGVGRHYVRVISMRAKKAAQKILEKSRYRYNFGDGWSACVSVREVTPSEAQKLRRKTNGFCGYDWMIDSIRNHGEITCSKQYT